MTFLYEKLNEKIYMQQPLGFVILSQEQNVFKLQKSIYSINNPLNNDI